MRNLIRIISTGGTIDSSPEYNPKEKSVFNGTNLSRTLEDARLTVSISHEPLFQKDSNDLDDIDRKQIWASCVNAPEDRIIVTHGTDTMTETAQFLGAKGVGSKVVVLVGSFVPLSQKDSDAVFNLGYALAAAHLLPSGVWVAMGGETYAWNNVKKNREVGRFESITHSD